MSAPASSSPSVAPHGGAIPSVPPERPPSWTAWAALGYLPLSLAGLALAPLPDVGADAGDVQRFLTSASPLPYGVGGIAELGAYLALLVFAVGLTSPARASGHRSAAGVLAPLGTALAAATLSTAAALVGAAVLTHGLPVPAAQAMLTAGSLATWLSVAGLALTLAALAALGPRGTSLPRWSARTAALVAVLLAAAIPFAESPWAHTPALLLDIWVLVTAALLLRRSRTARKR